MQNSRLPSFSQTTRKHAQQNRNRTIWAENRANWLDARKEPHNSGREAPKRAPYVVLSALLPPPARVSLRQREITPYSAEIAWYGRKIEQMGADARMKPH
jgi:hypothetical protein